MGARVFVYIVVVHLLLLGDSHASYPYLVDDSLGLGREFDGIGAISGGGATSKLLRNYPDEQRNQILDYLFKPGFGASLHILKVEIGGDSQSSDGVEASHMHTEFDENYTRGYEWWLMREAKKRNPAIKLYGLPWVFPGWLGKGTFSPYSNKTNLVRYITNWIHGAAKVHNLTIDYIGIWNERPYDTEYIKMLRIALDNQGQSHVRIVAADREWDFLPDMIKDPQLADSVDIIGVHYPGTHSPPQALSTDRKLWASEEYSAYNDIRGGGCWARVLNEGYVNGYLTSNIAWNLIASYYEQLPYPRSSLMTAQQPWSGHYDVTSPVWFTAHHAQFMRPRWRYHLHGYGVGNLTGNGTYVALISPDRSHLTLIIETMNPADASCFYSMPKYNVADSQVATFRFRGTHANIKRLYVWYSKLDFEDGQNTLFQRMDPIDVIDGTFSLFLERNVVYTLTTIMGGRKGDHGAVPAQARFPRQYNDNFNHYNENTEPNNFAPQAGVFEIRETNDSFHGRAIMQVVPEPPIDTCLPLRMPRPIAVIGDFNSPDVFVQVDSLVPSSLGGASGVFLALRIDKGGCDAMYSNGVYFWLYPAAQNYIVSGNHNRSHVYKIGTLPLTLNKWFTITLAVWNDTAEGYVNFKKIFTIHKLTSVTGFTGLGTEEFGVAYFDNFAMKYSNNTDDEIKNVLHKDVFRSNKVKFG